MEFVRDVFVDGFIHRVLPVDFGKQVEVPHAQRRRNNQHVKIGDVDCAAFDFGNGAAGGVVPASVLQFDGKVFLRPAVLLCQLKNHNTR